AVLLDQRKEDGESGGRIFEQWHADLKSNSADARKVVLLEVEAKLRRLQPACATGLGQYPDPCRARRGAQGKGSAASYGARTNIRGRVPSVDDRRSSARHGSGNGPRPVAHEPITHIGQFVAQPAQLGKVEQIAAYIAAHYREPLRVAEIAAS